MGIHFIICHLLSRREERRMFCSLPFLYFQTYRKLAIVEGLLSLPSDSPAILALLPLPLHTEDAHVFYPKQEHAPREPVHHLQRRPLWRCPWDNPIRRPASTSTRCLNSREMSFRVLIRVFFAGLFTDSFPHFHNLDGKCTGGIWSEWPFLYCNMFQHFVFSLWLKVHNIYHWNHVKDSSTALTTFTLCINIIIRIQNFSVFTSETCSH